MQSETYRGVRYDAKYPTQERLRKVGTDDDKLASQLKAAGISVSWVDGWWHIDNASCTVQELQGLIDEMLDSI